MSGQAGRTGLTEAVYDAALGAVRVYVEEHRTIANSDLRALTGLNYDQAIKFFNRAAETGVLLRQGRGSGTHYVQPRLPNEDRATGAQPPGAERRLPGDRQAWAWTWTAECGDAGGTMKAQGSVDEITRAFLELKFEVAFLTKKGNEFQDFFASVMEKRYPADFIRVRPWGNVGDRKNDGYLRSQRTLFQVYAPNDLTSAEALSKIDEDYNGALPFWKAHFDMWVFVHNSKQGLGPDVTRKLLDLDSGGSPSVTSWGFEELRRAVFDLDAPELASLLGPAPGKRDVLDLGMETLAPILDHLATMADPAESDLRLPPADKIARNLLSIHAATLLKAGMTRAPLVHRYFGVQPTKRDEIADSLRTRYVAARSRGLTPDEVFSDLQQYAQGDPLPTPARQSGVLAVLAFFFEECDIFEREPQDGGAR